jgi:uncharacterized protein (TIGR00290 family)
MTCALPGATAIDRRARGTSSSLSCRETARAQLFAIRLWQMRNDRLPVVMSWSGGKDSALALWRLRQNPAFDLRAVLTTITEGYERISMHAIRVSILIRQASEIGVPVVRVPIPPDCPNALYQERMNEALDDPRIADVLHFAFGDLFLEDVRAYRESQLATASKRGVFPLWGEDTAELARSFIKDGFRAILTCVDPRRLDASFAGRYFDDSLLRDLPEGVDPCGENGEFHTLVFEGPIFTHPIRVEVGEVARRAGFVFCDVRTKTEDGNVGS